MNPDQARLAKLQRYHARHRALPSYAAVAEIVGFRSKNAVAKLVGRLEVAGYLERTEPDHRLVPGKRFFERPLFEHVRAGFPSPANESMADAITIDQYLIERPTTTVLVTVKGDSMIDAGINAGDIVVVEKRHAARDGDIVVAIVDDEFTLKYLARDRKGVYLRAANNAYPPIRPKGNLEIFGVVAGLFRKYAR